jgi:hypothetical protein
MPGGLLYLLVQGIDLGALLLICRPERQRHPLAQRIDSPMHFAAFAPFGVSGLIATQAAFNSLGFAGRLACSQARRSTAGERVSSGINR